MTFPRSIDPTLLQRQVQTLEQRVKALEAVIKISGSNVEVKSLGEIKLTAGSKIEANAGGQINLKGALINLN
jgi:hypothetical protein